MISKLKLLIAGLFLSILYTNAQMSTSSPYSRFGFGEIVKPGFAANHALGGTGISLRGNGKTNFINPASLTAIDTMSFLFDFGMNYMHVNYSTNLYKTKLDNFNIDHIAIGFPVTRWWKAGASVMPFSRIGYNIKDASLLPVIGITEFMYEGTGGLSRFVIGNAFNIADGLSVGANLSYLFGNMTHQQRIQFPSDPYAGMTINQDKLRIKGMTYNFGAQYTKTFMEKYFATLGVTYDPKANLNADRERVENVYFPGSPAAGPDSTVINPVYILSSDTITGKTSYPSKFGIGLSTGITEKLILSAEYSTQDWSSISVIGSRDSLQNYQSMNFGLEYIPGNTESVKRYYKSISYRLGGYYTKSYLALRDNQLKDYGISFGLGFPFRNKTSFNLGFVAGQRGTLNRDLVKENYFMISISLSFIDDRWFFKSVID